MNWHPSGVSVFFGNRFSMFKGNHFVCSPMQNQNGACHLLKQFLDRPRKYKIKPCARPVFLKWSEWIFCPPTSSHRSEKANSNLKWNETVYPRVHHARAVTDSRRVLMAARSFSLTSKPCSNNIDIMLSASSLIADAALSSW